MKLPKISIVIPSFNKADYIEETLKSIVSQKHSNLEIIIQDGGSTDGTLEIIKNYVKKYPKIINYESKKDNGQVDAINKGFKRATGDILAYINADDIYFPGAFDKILKMYLSNRDTIWFAGQGKVIDLDGSEIAKPITWYKNLLLSLNSKFYLLITNYIMQPSVFITRQAFEKVEPFTGLPNGVVMEYKTWLKLVRVSMPVVINETLSAFRISQTNISSVAYKNILKEDEAIVKKFTKNKFIFFLHRLNNLLRVTTIKVINR